MRLDPSSTAQAVAGGLSLLAMRAEHPLSLATSGSVVLATRSGADLYLELARVGEDGTRVRLAEDDDGGDGLDARIEASLEPGAYVVIVRPYAATTGPYLLEARLDH
jgi:hypothetical protein